MGDQSYSVLEEAVRLVDVLRKTVNVGGGGRSGDVWSEATRERDRWTDHIATGEGECRYCPVCRAIAATRTSGPGVLDNLMAAGESLLSAAREAAEGLDRTRPSRPEPYDGPVDIG